MASPWQHMPSHKVTLRVWYVRNVKEWAGPRMEVMTVYIVSGA